LRWERSDDDGDGAFTRPTVDDDDDDDDVVAISLNFLLDVLFIVNESIDKFVGVMTGELGRTSIELIDPASPSSVGISYLGLRSNMGRDTEILFLGRSLLTGAVGMSSLFLVESFSFVENVAW
jgi:hypothetical protein